MFLNLVNVPKKNKKLVLLESFQTSPYVEILGFKLISVTFDVSNSDLESFTFIIGENSYTAKKKWKDYPCVGISTFFRWEIKGISLRHDNDLEITKKELEKIVKEFYPRVNVTILKNMVRCYIKEDIESLIIEKLEEKRK